MRILILVAVLAVPSWAQLHLKRVALVPHGPESFAARLVIADTDSDGRGEVIYGGVLPMGWQVLEYEPVNRYGLAASHFGVYPLPESLVLGNFIPYDAGDIDRDGKVDLVGLVYFRRGTEPKIALVTVESRNSTSFPDTINWFREYPGSSSGYAVQFITDLDQDSAREILAPWSPGTGVFENVADDRESLVFAAYPYKPVTFGDYDQNGRMDYVCDRVWWEHVSECTGDNQYAVVCSLETGLPNSADYFSGSDVDMNGKPEFFVTYARYVIGYVVYLYQFEAVAEHEYAYYLIDSVRLNLGNVEGRNSICVDLDGDDVEEVVWSCCTHVQVLATVAPHRFEKVAEWWNDHGEHHVSLCNAADFNGNGYNELYIGGDYKVSVLEVEAIRLHSPNGGQELLPGDTCWIRWRLLRPPFSYRVSLFLLTDTEVPQGRMFWDLDTIATGVSPRDTLYPWVVPDTVLDAAWIVAITYGPGGWQFDASDEPFSIVPSGLAEEARGRSKPVAVRTPTVIGRMLLLPEWTKGAALLDVTGRRVIDLAPGETDVSHVAPGVYFVLRASGVERKASSVHKVVIQH